MKLSAEKIVLGVLISVVALFWTVHECFALGFRGGGKFSSIPFDQSGEYVFHFREDHNLDVTLLLEVEGEPDRLELTHLQTIMEVTLVNHAGRTICQAVGKPTDGISRNNWVLRTSRDEAAFWHHNCAEIKLRHSESYTLTVCIRDVDPKTPKIRLTPIFERSDNYGP